MLHNVCVFVVNKWYKNNVPEKIEFKFEIKNRIIK